MQGKRLVGIPQCPSCCRDVLPGSINTEYEYEDVYLGGDPLCRGNGYASLDPVRSNVIGIFRTHSCGYLLSYDFKMRWVMEDDTE